MIKKILLLATVAFSLLISGCDQPLPPTDNPPKVDNPTDKPEKPPVKLIEKPPVNPAPENPDNEPPETITPDTQAQKISVKVYYPDDAGINLVAVKRTVEIKSDAEKYLAAVNLLMDNPNEKDLTVFSPKTPKLKASKFPTVRRLLTSTKILQSHLRAVQRAKNFWSVPSSKLLPNLAKSSKFVFLSKAQKLKLFRGIWI